MKTGLKVACAIGGHKLALANPQELLASLPPPPPKKETSAVPVMRHRLRKCLPFWKTFVTSSLVLLWIEFGYKIKWINGPPMAQAPYKSQVMV
jgi:hypothetical protein